MVRSGDFQPSAKLFACCEQFGVQVHGAADAEKFSFFLTEAFHQTLTSLASVHSCFAFYENKAETDETPAAKPTKCFPHVIKFSIFTVIGKTSSTPPTIKHFWMQTFHHKGNKFKGTENSQTYPINILYEQKGLNCINY